MLPRPFPAICSAVATGNLSLVKQLMADSVNLYTGYGEHGDTPLHLAVRAEQIQIVEFLIACGAVPELKNADTQNALELAVEGGNLALTRYFIETLHVTALPYTKKEYLNDLLDRICEWKEGKQEYPHKLVFTDTILHTAARHGYSEIMEYLLSKKLYVDALGSQSQTPLLTALQYGQKDIVKILLSHSAELRAVDKEGRGVFEYAALGGKEECIDLLLSTKQVQPVFSPERPHSPLHYAVEANAVPLIKFFLDQYPVDANFALANNDTLLARAIQYHAVDALLFLLAHGADPNLPSGPDKKTPLMLAAEQREGDMVQGLLNYKATVSKKDKKGRTALLLAAGAGDLEIVTLLVAKGAKPTEQDREQKTALHYAALSGNVPLLEYLLSEAKLPLDQPDTFSRTALFYAAQAGNLSALECLLEKGADSNCKDSSSHTILQSLAETPALARKETQEEGKDILQELEEQKISLSKDIEPLFAPESKLTKFVQTLRDPLLTTLFTRVNTVLQSLQKEKTEEEGKKELREQPEDEDRKSANLIALFIEKGVKIDILDNDKYSLICSFAKHRPIGYFHVISLLASKGAPLDDFTSEGHTALFYAVKANDYALTKLLVEHGADVNAHTETSASPFLTALEEGASKEITELLFEAGGDINQEYPDGETPLQHAIMARDNDKVAQCFAYKADPQFRTHKGVAAIEAFIIQSMTDLSKYKKPKVTILKLLLEHGADINALNLGGETPLEFAIAIKAYPVAEILMKYGADPTIIDEDGTTALHLIFSSHHNLGGLSFDKLVKSAEDANRRNSDGYTLAHCAALCESDHIPSLIKKGVDLTAVDSNGNTALMIAAVHKNETAADILAKAGEKQTLMQKNKEGKTALYYIIINKLIDPLQVFIEKGIDFDQDCGTGISYRDLAKKVKIAIPKKGRSFFLF